MFNLEVAQAKNEEQANRLEPLKQDDETIIKKRYDAWQEVIGNVEEEFKAFLLTITADRLMD